MFNEIISKLNAHKKDFLHLKRRVSGTTLESSIDNILNAIYDDIKILLKGEI